MSKPVIGKKSVLDALKKSIKFTKIVLSKDKPNLEIQQLATDLKCKIEFWDIYEFNRFFGNKNVNHQFCLGFIETNSIQTIEELIQSGKNKVNPIIVILDEINDPQNFGAIIRTCAAADVLGIIHKKHHQAPLNNVTIKASMGTNALLPIIPVSNLLNAINLLKKNDYWILVTSTDQGSIPYWKVPRQRAYAVVVGNEANGVGQLIKKNADYLITIPIKGEVQSLNVNAATGIIIFDLIRE